jgi:hypothetical protein
MNLSIPKPDLIGAGAGTLCLIHCLATPFLFIAWAGSSGSGGEAPAWWTSLNYAFLIISFIAVYRSAQTTSQAVMKPLLWISWTVLAFVMVNETFQWLALAETISYAAAITLVVLHIVNRKYCNCKNDKCCANAPGFTE